MTTSRKDIATAYLSSLINKTLRITTTDMRMFLGEFKCTDRVRFPPSCPISHSHPFPFPLRAVRSASILSKYNFFFLKTSLFLVPKTDAIDLQDRNIILGHTYEYRLPSPPSPQSPSISTSTSPPTDKIVLDLTSRYLGLVVVPGNHIAKIEVEEFASQVRDDGGVRRSRWLLSGEALGVGIRR